MKRKKQPPFRLSERVHLRHGDLIRVSGGPVYEHDGERTRLGIRGVVAFDHAETHGGRPYIVVRTLESVGKRGGLLGRFETLYVGAEPFASPLLSSVVNRPYRVRRLRRKAR